MGGCKVSKRFSTVLISLARYQTNPYKTFSLFLFLLTSEEICHIFVYQPWKLQWTCNVHMYFMFLCLASFTHLFLSLFLTFIGAVLVGLQTRFLLFWWGLTIFWLIIAILSQKASFVILSERLKIRKVNKPLFVSTFV